MDALREQLLDKVAALACELSPGQCEALALEIEGAGSPRAIRQVAGLPAPKPVTELCDLWQRIGDMPATHLADALRCAARAVETTTSYEKVELLYTGPRADVIRRTRQGLLEVVRAARHRLWLVSYVVGIGVDEVLAAANERAESGVEVKILVDHRTDAGGQGLTRLAKHAHGCQVFVWPDEQREMKPGHFANLHAKCAVADGRKAFVSSANLTGWAMDHNLEVGYLVTGGPSPRTLDEYFQELAETGVLQARIDGAA